VKDIEAEGITVLAAGPGNQVTGDGLLQCLTRQGFVSAYAIAGPRALHTLVSAGVLDRLYLTCAHRLLGGTVFDTFVWGESLNPTMDLELSQLYYDRCGPDGAQQWYSVFTSK